MWTHHIPPIYVLLTDLPLPQGHLELNHIIHGASGTSYFFLYLEVHTQFLAAHHIVTKQTLKVQYKQSFLQSKTDESQLQCCLAGFSIILCLTPASQVSHAWYLSIFLSQQLFFPNFPKFCMASFYSSVYLQRQRMQTLGLQRKSTEVAGSRISRGNMWDLVEPRVCRRESEVLLPWLCACAIIVMRLHFLQLCTKEF